MARTITVYLLLALITALIGSFFVVDRMTRRPNRPANVELADRLSTLTFACPGVATLEVRDTRAHCLKEATTEQECFFAYRRLSAKFIRAAEKRTASDRCKIAVENALQHDLTDSARMFSGEPAPDRRELDRQFRDVQRALGQPQVGCSNLNEACSDPRRPSRQAGEEPSDAPNTSLEPVP